MIVEIEKNLCYICNLFLVMLTFLPVNINRLKKMYLLWYTLKFGSAGVALPSLPSSLYQKMAANAMTTKYNRLNY